MFYIWADNHSKLVLLLTLGVGVGIFISGMPVLWERTLFEELKPNSVLKADVDEAIKRAVAPIGQMGDADRKVCLENMDLLLRLPVMDGEPNDHLIKYRYSILSERVALRPVWQHLLLLLLFSLIGAFTFLIIARKPWATHHKHWQFLCMALSIFLLGGLLPYFVSARNAGRVALVGFYAALFTWIYSLRIDDPKEAFKLVAEPSVHRLNAIYNYCTKLLAFAFAIFGGVTIALMLHVSRTIGETYAIGTSFKQRTFFWLILNDFYGSTVLFVGAVGSLVQTLMQVILLYPDSRQHGSGQAKRS